MPLISVILPTCDRPKLVDRALASVLAQRGVEFEVVLVDNNHSMPSLEVPRDERVRLIRAPEAPNAAAARNTGLAIARGDWTTFLDDDDEYAPGKLAGQLALATDTDMPFVLCGYVVPRGPRLRRIQCEVSKFSGDQLLLDAVWGTPFLFHRRDPEHFFDESLHAAEDCDYALRYLARHRVRMVPNIPEPLVCVHLQPSGRVNTHYEAHWHACRRTLVRQRAHYSRLARRRYLLRAQMQRQKGPDGDWRRLLAAGSRLLRVGGKEELRRVLNAWLWRTGCFDRWLVS